MFYKGYVATGVEQEGCTVLTPKNSTFLLSKGKFVGG